MSLDSALWDSRRELESQVASQGALPGGRVTPITPVCPLGKPFGKGVWGQWQSHAKWIRRHQRGTENRLCL